jgi:hypothetical protein
MNPFMIQQPDIVGNYAQGFEVGAAISDRQRAMDAEKANAEMNAQFQNDLYGLYQNTNATAKDYGAMQIKYPQMAESIKSTWSGLNAEKQATHLSEMTEVLSALNNGQPDYAIGLLQNKADAARNSGDEDAATRYEAMVAKGKYDPNLLKTTTASTLTAIKGTEYVDGILKQPYTGVKAAGEARKTSAEADVAEIGAEFLPAEKSQGLDKGAVDIADTESNIEDRIKKTEIELRKTALEEKKLAIEEAKAGGVPLEKDARELINNSADNASKYTANAARADDLSARVDKFRNKAGGGAWQSIEEMAANTSGWKDQESAIRAEVKRVLTPIALSNYKKFTSGATSDRDIETALGGYPKETDSPQVLSSFLTGLSKMQKYDAELEKAKVSWTSKVGSLADSPKDLEIKGVKVPAGMSYGEFEQTFMANQFAKANQNAIPKAAQGKKYILEVRK